MNKVDVLFKINFYGKNYSIIFFKCEYFFEKNK